MKRRCKQWDCDWGYTGRICANPSSFPKDVERAVAEVNRSGKASSEAAYLTFLLGTSRVSHEMKRALGKQACELMQRVDILTTQREDEKRERRAREGDVEWEEILECGERFTEQERLIFALYTLLPPQRADFGVVQIVASRARATDDEGNYFARKEEILPVQKWLIGDSNSN